ncbi:hypothetical protein [Ammoniphilus sp. YIM 78166]|uniref:hypothetical protein n=1 Tax=Ammoniphilus sp. YIM 78166 TaxID=1644106 RepID=UPI0010702720|nr:hypothetical protein [Ammoniphilus sp. YIM 78166]
MQKNDFIQEQMQSSDPFVSELFHELNDRVQEFTNQHHVVKKIAWSDTIVPLIIMVLITLNLIMMIV